MCYNLSLMLRCSIIVFHLFHPMRALLTAFILSCCTGGCAVVAIGDAAVTVVATTVKVGAVAAGAVVDVGAAGVRAVTGSGD